MIYAQPGTPGAIVSFKARYGNFIGGEFVAPAGGRYFTNTSPVNGQPIAEFPRSDAADIDKALDAAHAAAEAWGRTSVQERSHILLKIADRIEANLSGLMGPSSPRIFRRIWSRSISSMASCRYFSNRAMMACTSSAERFQFSVENAYSVRYSIPSSSAA